VSALIAGGAVEVEVALALGLEAGTGRWDDPAAVFGVTRWGQSDSSLGDWVDVTCQTLELHLEMSGDEPDPLVPLPYAGTCTGRLIGDLFDPWTGPWQGLIGEGTAARVRARASAGDSWSTVIDGQVTAYTWDPAGLVAELEVTDRLMLLNFDLPAVDPPVGGGEVASARIGRLLDRAEWSGGRALVAGGEPMLPTTLDGAGITSLRTIAESDLGLLTMSRDATISYLPGGFPFPVTPTWALTVCPTPGETHLVTMDTRAGGQLVNVCSISRQSDEGTEADTYTAREETSVARYGPRTYKRTDLQHSDPAQSQTVAQFVVARDAWPSRPPVAVTLDSRIDPAAAVCLLLADTADRVDVRGMDGTVSTLIVTGWQVDVDHFVVAGHLRVTPESVVTGAVFDRAVWDSDRWEAA
jgi:hypothetical protein